MSFPKIVLAAVIAPVVVAAQSPTGTEQTAKASKPAGWDPSEIVCKKFPPPVGSRIGPRRICKSNAEWDMIDRLQEEAVEAVQKKPYTAN